MLDLITIGDITTDVFLHIKDAEVFCDIKSSSCQLCVGFGEKIPMDRVTYLYGVGNAPNVAVGFSRLDFSSAIYTIIGDDEQGQKAKDALTEEGVSTEYIVTDFDKPTDYSAVLLYEGERTIFVSHEKRKYLLPELPQSKWIFLGSIGQDSRAIHKKIISELKKTGSLLACNLGPVQLRMGMEPLIPLLKNIEVLFLNKQEAQLLFGRIASMKSLIKKVRSFGSNIVVITDGAIGSYAFDGKTFYFQKAIPTKVVESTGSGDAYATGFLAAYHKGFPIPVAMSWGAKNAASVLRYIGARAGLLKNLS